MRYQYESVKNNWNYRQNCVCGHTYRRAFRNEYYRRIDLRYNVARLKTEVFYGKERNDTEQSGKKKL